MQDHVQRVRVVELNLLLCVVFNGEWAGSCVWHSIVTPGETYRYTVRVGARGLVARCLWCIHHSVSGRFVRQTVAAGREGAHEERRRPLRRVTSPKRPPRAVPSFRTQAGVINAAQGSLNRGCKSFPANDGQRKSSSYTSRRRMTCRKNAPKLLVGLPLKRVILATRSFLAVSTLPPPLL